MQQCWFKGYKKVIIEGDYKKDMDLLNRKSLYFSGYNWIREVFWWKEKFEANEFVWIRREANRAADTLAKMNIPFNNSYWFIIMYQGQSHQTFILTMFHPFNE